MTVLVSIIIPTWRHSGVLDECLDHIRKLQFPVDQMEIILVSADPLNFSEEGLPATTIVPIDQDVNQGQARNIASQAAKGEYLAFIDDDSFVPPKWLSRALGNFDDPAVGAVGGPALPDMETSPHANKLGALFLASPWITGYARKRYAEGFPEDRDASEDDLVLCNNLVRKSVFQEVGGFNPVLVPCEENDLYIRIRKCGYRLVYAPEAHLQHPAKPAPWHLLSKIGYYAVGRGMLMYSYPETIRFSHLMPLFAVGAFIAMVVSLFFWPSVALLFFLVLSAGVLFVLIRVLVDIQKNGILGISSFISTLVFLPLLPFYAATGILKGFGRMVFGVKFGHRMDKKFKGVF